MTERIRLGVGVMLTAVVTGALYQVWWRAPVLGILDIRWWQVIGAGIIVVISAFTFYWVRKHSVTALGIWLGLVGGATWLAWTAPTDSPEGFTRSLFGSLTNWREFGPLFVLACVSSVLTSRILRKRPTNSQT